MEPLATHWRLRSERHIKADIKSLWTVKLPFQKLCSTCSMPRRKKILRSRENCYRRGRIPQCNSNCPPRVRRCGATYVIATLYCYLSKKLPEDQCYVFWGGGGGGSLADLKQSLQAAIDVTEEFLTCMGLKLSPTKSELLLYRQSRQGVGNLEPLETLPVEIATRGGHLIPRVNSIKILGLLINAKGCIAEALNKLGAQAKNILRLVSKRGGLKEDKLLGVFQAFFISHITCTAPYLKWSKSEKNKPDTLIRSSVKRILRIPQSASTVKLLELGIHNITDELIEAQFIAQISRLSSTKQRIKILDEAGLHPIQAPLDRRPLSKLAREGIKVEPVPRNIHPIYNEGCRRARTRTIFRQIDPYGADAFFVDATKCGSKYRFAISVVDARGTLISAASIYTKHMNEAEETAIALALQAAKSPTTIFSDSRVALVRSSL
nr:uncharacterized protein LOC129380469 [Dermacentor andersoni]